MTTRFHLVLRWASAWLIVLTPVVHHNSPAQPSSAEALTVIALGDVGDAGSDWRASAFYVTDMYTGRHDAGKPGMLLFLGDNFMPLGLNIPSADVEGTVADLFRPLREVLTGIPRERVHAIPGEHDYYSRFAEERTALFGLIRTGEGPTGITDKGNGREFAIEQWTYHRGATEEAIVPLADGSRDSVQFIFFDSALLLRTDPSRWRPMLGSLEAILDASRNRERVLWRILCAHHPWYSLGVHGGYSRWNDEDSTVEYLTNCDRDSNATGFLRNWLDPEDLCAERYRNYIDSVRSTIRRVGVKIHVLVSAHDRSLQFLVDPDHADGRDPSPAVQIVSGAGSLRTRVRHASPPGEFTSAPQNPGEEGVSPPGFAQLQFGPDRLRVEFFNSKNGDVIDMGGGQTVFWVDREGRPFRP